MKKLLQSLCWWVLMLFISYSASAQVQYKIEYNSATQRYQVAMKPLANYSGTAAYTGSAQVTLVVPTGGNFTPTALQSQFGAWNLDNAIVRTPSENPSFDYVSFYMPSTVTGVNYTSNVEMPLFSFAATGGCTGGINLINNATDPFMPNPTNSKNINVGNQISIFGYQNNLLANAYQSNYGNAAACANNNSCAIQYEIVKTGNTYQVNMIPNVTYAGVGNTTSTQQVTIKAPTGLAYTNLTSLTSGANYIQGSRVNAPSQSTSNDYIMFNLSNLGTTALSYTAGVSVPLFKFDVPGTCSGSIGFMPNNDPFTANTSFNSKQQVTMFGYGQPDAPICFVGTGSVPCPTVAPPPSCAIQYEIVKNGNTYQVNMIPNVTYTGVGNTTSTQQVTIKAPTGLAYTNLTSLTSGANYIQGSRVNAPSQSTSNDYIMFNLSNLGTTALSYTAGVSVPLFKFDVPGTCSGSIGFMPNNDPFTANTSFNSKQQVTMFGYGQPDAPICFVGSGSVSCPTVAPSCGIEYELELLANGKYQVSMIPKVTYVAPNNITSTQQITLKVPTGFQYTGLTNLTGATYIQGSRVNAPSQATGFDYIMFNLSNLGTSDLTYTNGVKVPLFTFDKSGLCKGPELALMPNNDPFTANTSFNSKQQLTVFGYGQPDIPICLKGTGKATCTDNNPATCTIKYELETVNGCEYQVSMIPDVSWTSPNDITKAAKVTLRVPHGCFTISNLTSLNFGANFTVVNTVLAPADNPAYDYICLSMTTVPTVAIPYVQGQKVSLFTFKNSGTCCGNIELMPFSDPFAHGNSLNQNFDQYWQTSGTGSNGVEPCIVGNAQPCVSSQGSNILGPDRTICAGQTTQLNVTGSFTSYTWTGTGLSATNTANPTASPLSTTTYYVTATTASGCPIKDDVVVNVTSAPTFTTVTATPSNGCASSNGSVTINATGSGTIEYSINNGTTWQLQNVFSNLAAGSYTVKIRQQGSTCETLYPSNPVVVTSSGSPTIVNVSGANPTCGASDGQISITVSGAGGPFRYSINDGTSYQLSDMFSGLAAGTYNIKVTDASGVCSITYPSVTLTAPNAPQILSATPTASSNCSNPNGLITISANGTAPLFYSIDGVNWQTSNTFSNLAPNTYLVKVRTGYSNNCITTAATPVVVTSPAIPAVQTISSITPTTCALTNGSISITATGGAGTYEYSKDNGASWQTSNTFSNLASGTYYVKIRTVGSTCSAEYPGNPVVLNHYSAPAITALTKIGTSNCGTNDGQIIISAIGNGNLEYSINNGTTWQASNTFSNLSSGTYNIVVRATNNTACTSIVPNCVIPALSQPTINNFTANPISNCGSNDGTITINATGGLAPLQYSIDDINWQNSNVFIGVAAGSYTLRVRNSNASCTNTGNTAAVVTSPSAPSIVSATPTNATCGQNNGTITIATNGGVAPLQYSIDNIFWQNTNVFNNVPAGTYTAYVRNANGLCVSASNAPVVVTQTTGPNISIVTVTNSNTCISPNGAISITANGGTAPLQYSIDGGVNFQTSSSFSGVPAGTYNLVVRNANTTCPAMLSPVVVTAPTAPSIVTTISTNPLGCGVNNGSVQILANTNVAVEYSIDNINWQASNTFSNLTAGAYTVRVRNVGNTSCAAVGNAPINLTPTSTPPTVTNVTKTNPSACGSASGSINVTANPSTGVQYSIDNIHWQNTSSFSNLVAGSYQVYVRNQNGTCPVAYSQNPITLTAPGAQTISNVSLTNPSTCGINDGQISITVSGTGGPYRYSINGGTSYQMSPYFVGLAAGTYNILVSMSNGDCPTSVPAVVLTAPIAPQIIAVTPTNVTDCNQPNGVINVNATGGVSPLEYSLDGNIWQSSNIFANLSAGSYLIKVRNTNNSCVTTASAPVSIAMPAMANFSNVTATAPTACGTANGSISITATGGTAPLQYSIDGGANWASNGTFSGLASGTYFVMVRNNGGSCAKSYPGNPVVINAGGAPSIINITKTMPSTCGQNDGSIVITAAGTGNLEYSINNGVTFQTSNTFTGLSSASYNIVVRAAGNNACTSVVPNCVIPALNAPNLVSATATPSSDCNQNDGTITVNATGGNAPLYYSIDGNVWQTANVFTNVLAGNYTVRVRNANGTCVQTSSTQTTVTQPTAPTSVSAITTPAACGQTNGTITATAVGGSAPLQYSIDGINWQTANTFNAVPAGTYTVFARNNNTTCKTPSASTVTVTNTGGANIVSVNLSNSTNCGVNNGEIIVGAVGGIAPLSYSINGGVTFQTNNTFTALAAGNYNVVVRNANNTCPVILPPLALTAPNAPSIINVLANNPSSCTTNDGALTVFANGGNAPLEYSLDGNSWQTANIFNNLAAGSYTVRVRNGNGSCMQTAATPITLTTPAAAVITNVSKTDPTTCGSANGSMTITATPNTGVQYSIDNIHWQTATVFSNLAAGTYTAYIRYNNGTCKNPYNTPVVLNATGAHNIANIGVSNPSDCNKNDGEISISVNGVGGPFRYSINGGTVFQASPMFVGLAAGTYNIVVTDASGLCAIAAPAVTITAPTAPQIAAVTPTSTTDCGLNDGEITVTAFGGIAPLQYSINGTTWQTSNTFTGLAAGSYLIQVRNATGSCKIVANAPVNVAMPAMPTITTVAATAPAACGQNTGSITVSATGGAGQLEYSIDQLNWVTNPTFAGLASGTYYVFVRNQDNSCSKPYSGNPVVLNASGAPQIANVTKNIPSNCGTNDGSIVITATGSATLEYSINGGQTYQAANTFNGLASGSYNVMVRVVGGNSACTSSVPNCIIPTLTQPTISTVNTTNPLGCGQNTGSLNIVANGGVAPLYYSINNGTSWQQGNVFAGLAAGSYTVKVRNANGTCEFTYTGSVTLTQPATPNVISATSTPSTCGQNSGSVTITANGGSGSLEYSINGIAWQVSNIFNNIPAGTYTTFVRNAGSSCQSSGTSTVTVTQTGGANIANVIVTNISICGQNNGSIQINATGGTPPLQYSINGGQNFQTLNTFSNLAAGSYNIVVSNSGGTCPAVLSPIDILAPSTPTIVSAVASSPTGCNLNDGSIVVLANGNGVLEYSLNGTTWQTSNTFTGLAAGSYTPRVRVQGSTTCTATASTPTVLTAPVAPVINSVTSTNPATCNTNNGSITVTATPNTGVQYSVNGIVWQNAGLFTGLAAGTYTVQVRNGNGACITNYTSPVTLTATGGVQAISIVVNSDDCSIPNNGKITILASGGTAPYSYSLNGGAAQISNMFTNLSPNTYTITVKDATNSCQNTITASIAGPTAPAAPTANATPSNSCELSNGSITVTTPLGAYEYSINNGLSWQITTTFNALSEGNYIVSVRKIGTTCTSNSAAPISVGAPVKPFVANVVAANPTACGISNGTITITATASTGTLQYSIDNVNWQASNSFVNLPNGTYTVFVRNQNASCATPYLGNPVVLNNSQAPAITGVLIEQSGICNGNDAKITVTALGATEYSKDNGVTWQASNVFSNLAAGDYNIRTRSSATCVSNFVPITINGQNAPTAATVTTSPSSDCNLNNGSLQVSNVTGGTAPYEYSIDGINWQTSNTFVSLAAGNYTVRVRNAGQICVFTNTTTSVISAPTAPIINSVTKIDAPCGSVNGQIIVSASAGALMSIDGINYQSSGTFTNLAPGTYMVFVKNANGTCTVAYAQNPLVISSGAAPTISSVTATNPTDCNQTNGILAINATGGIAPLSYSIDGGATFQPSSVFNNIAPGTYSIVVRGSGTGTNCPVTYAPVTVKAPREPRIVANVSTNPTACQNNGKIVVYASDGNAPLTYSLDGITWQASNEFNNIAAGSYTIRVRNNNTSCVKTNPTTTVLTAPLGITINNVAKTNPTACTAIDGTITVTATASLGVQYSIDNIHWQTSNNFTGLAAGAYTVFVRNNDGTCATPYAQNPVVLSGAGAPTITAVDVMNVSDCNKVDGTINVHVTGNASQYKYSIDNGVTYQLSTYFSGLTAGNYTVKVTDLAGNCPATYPNVIITAPTAAAITAVNATPTSNCGTANGSIAITAAGTNLQYSINNGANWTTNNVFNNLAAGSYIVKVRNADGKCEQNYPTAVEVTEPTKPAFVSVSHTDPLLCGQNTGTINIVASGGTGTYEYSINGTTWQPSGSFTGLSAGAYTVMVRNAGSNCPVQYATLINVAAPPAPSYILVNAENPSTCLGNNGKITVTATGSGALEYSINGGTNYQASNIFTGLVAGNYNIRVRNVGGTCEITYPTVILTAPVVPQILAATPTAATDCAGNDGKITVVASGTGVLEYSIDGTNWQSSNTFMGLTANTYTIRVRVQGTACIATSSSVAVTAPNNAPVINNVAKINPTGCGKNDGSITISSTPNTGVMYSIDGINWTINNVFSNLASGSYTVKVRNANGTCTTPYSSLTILNPGPTSPQVSNVTVTNVTDCAATNGSISITATGGTAPYQYSIDGGTTFQNTATYNNLPAGYYDILVRNNDNSCATLHVPVEVKGPAAPAIIAAILTKPTDCSIPNAKITVFATGGMSPLQYSIDNGTTWSSNNSFTGLAPGYYNIKVRNNNGTCVQTNPNNPIVSCEFDLALRKKLTNKSDSITSLGRDINFTITVYNQGAVAAKDIEVVDYLPTGLMLSPTDQNGWTMLPQSGKPLGALQDPSLPMTAKKIITQTIKPGDSATIQIKLRVMFGAPFAKLKNVAEIAGARDESGTIRQDGDSTPDETKGNDKEIDDKIDDKGSIDEDDEDPAPIQLDAYDPHGYIYCDKSNTLLKGGKVILVSGPVGGSIFFANDNNGQPIDGRDGVYQFFTNGIPGNYTMGYTHPQGYTLSPMRLPQVGSFNPAGTDNTSIDKDGTANNIVTLGSSVQGDSLIKFAPIENPYYLNFTFNANETTIISHNNLPVSCACANVNVCVDTNGDGVPTAGETGVNGATVELYNCATNVLVQTGVTTNGGKLKLSGLLAGNYKLKYIPPAGYVFATNPSGQTVGIDNQGNTTCFPLGYTGCEEKAACVKLCPTVSVTPNVTICAGASTTLAASGGTTYSWTGAGLSSNTGASVTATPTTTTVYTVTNIGGGCSTTSSVTVTVVNPPSSNNFTVSSTQPSTCASTNGSITVNATGSLEYSINNGNTWQTSNTFSNLIAGSYIVKIRTLGSTCEVTYGSNPIDLTPISAANITSVTSVNPNNCTTPNGSISITANGGTPPLQYSINNGVSYQASSIFNGLPAGTYKIKVKNGDNTCEITYSDVVLTNNQPIINAVNVVSDCANNNRSITILASGGVSPLEYSINGGTTWTTNNVFNGLTPGSYNVAVRNFNGTCIVNYSNGTIAMCNYDLALTKKLAAGQSSVVRLGDVINYQITIINQGSNPVKDVTVIDYLPQGMQLFPSGNNGWALVAGSTDMATNTITSTIAAGQSITLNMAVKLVFGSPNISLKNVAEIKSMNDTNGNPVADVDSTPDMVKGNDTEKDNVTNENGKNNPTDDEDDSDGENITLDNFDPSGYIYCEKTGRIITGGKMKLVSGPQGGDIFFATDKDGKLLDGSTGMYQIFTNGVSGTYTFTYEHPNNYPLSKNCLPQSGSFNPDGNDGNAAYDKDGTVNGMIHLGSIADGKGYLANKTCAENKYFLSFTLNKDEKILIATNNIPISCAVMTGTITNCDTKSGVNGMDVKIFDCDSNTGVAFANGKTNANGTFIFDDLKKGKYKVVISTPSGQIIQGGNFNQKGESNCIDVDFGQMVMNIDACLGACPTINNVLTVMPWCPKNNGVIIIDAVCQGDLEYSIDGGKTYQHLNAFMNLAPGTYTIKVKSAGCEKEYDKVVVLACENDNNGGKGSISGKAFKACTDSGIKGSSKGLAGVKVTLTSSTGATQNATTNTTGGYNFTNVDAGTYSVTFEKTSGFDFAKQNQGNDDSNDSDVDATGKTSVTVAANQLVDNVDAGFKDVQAPAITFIHPLLVGKKDGETVYMECGFEEILKATDATAKDNCDVNPIVKMEDGTAIVSKECDKDGFVVKMQCGWIATDECGNKTQIWLSIVVRDSKAPDMVGVPSNITITDKDVVPTAPNVLAKDKCDKDAKVIFAENKIGNVITLTWTASDACGNKTTATQIITISGGGSNPCTIAQKPVPVVYPVTCAGKDGKAKLTPNTYTYKWADGVIGDTRLDLAKGSYTVTATDANGCTAIVTFEIKDGCVTSTYKFASKGEIRQVACSTPQKDYCLDVDYVDFMLNYNLTNNGIDFKGKIKPCNTILHGEYSLAGLINTTLSVEEWTISGQKVSFDFTDLNDLVTKMNQYDSNGGWKLNALDATVENNNFKKNHYGNLIIGKKQFGLQWIIQASEFTISKGVNFMVEGMGKHEIVMRHKASNANDTMRLQFVCTTPNIFDVVLQEGDVKGVDIATTELVGAKCVIENHDDALQNKTAMFHNSGRRPSVINIEGMYQGAKQVMFTMCDEHNICDTATIRVIVYAKEKVIVEKDKTIKVFTGFSPNADGVNDVFTIENIEYHPENTLTVFNRWGNLIYSKEGYNNTWQGTFDNGNLPDGTYFYHLEVKGQKTRSGYVELRR